MKSEASQNQWQGGQNGSLEKEGEFFFFIFIQHFIMKNFLSTEKSKELYNEHAHTEDIFKLTIFSPLILIFTLIKEMLLNE